MIDMNFRGRLAKEGMLLGMQCFTGSPAIVEILGYAGFDWVSLDMEHAMNDFARIEHLTRAANCSGVTPLVRVADNDPLLIMKALDAGAAGVIVPHVASRADLERAVAATLYPPRGIRGACTATRASGYGADPWRDFTARANEGIVVVPLVEDREAIDAFDDLLAVKEVPAYWLGTTDLAQSLGCPGADFRQPQLASIARSLTGRAAAAGKSLMVTVSPHLTVEYAQYLASIGFRLISFGSDIAYFSRTIRDTAAAMRPSGK
jgi:2-keto-3-deoxy-L-rhamnonate aldolase RhmA